MKKTLTAFVLLLLVSFPAIAANQSPGITLEVTQGSAPQGTVIRIRNACSKPHKFATKINGLKAVQHQGDRSPVLVAPGQAIKVPFLVDPGSLKANTYRGTLFIKCKDCKKEPGCSQSRDTVPIELLILPSLAESPGGHQSAHDRRAFSEPAPPAEANTYAWIGEAHNRGTARVLERVDDLEPQKQIQSRAHELAREWVERVYPDLDTTPIEPEPATQEMIDRVVHLVGKRLSVQKFQRRLDTLDNQAANRLEGGQLALYSMTSATARSSNLFWRVPEEGGDGGYHYLRALHGEPVHLPLPPDDDSPRPLFKKLRKKVKDFFKKIDWGEVGKADVVGCITGAIAGGVEGCAVRGIGGSAGNFAGQTWDILKEGGG